MSNIVIMDKHAAQEITNPRVADKQQIQQLKNQLEQNAEQHFGYGILDKNNSPAWSALCVCEDPEPLKEEVGRLTDWYPSKAPYRIVKLSFEDIEVRP